jgi:hypothetical protein
MEELSREVGQVPGEGRHHGPSHEVTVTVDGVRHEVPRGEYVVSAFKKLVGVDPARELDEVVHGELKPLDDSAHIHIIGWRVIR